jgi:metal-sulfur cluster biosynthetic enzyme
VAVDKDEIWAVLKTIQDPEIPLNIVDLGLVYEVKIEGGHVTVDMTLTTAGCPAAVYFPSEVKSRIMAVEGTEDATVNIVWNPPWSLEKVTEEGKLFLESMGIRTG